jgi:hypothetical protein
MRSATTDRRREMAHAFVEIFFQQAGEFKLHAGHG